LRTWLDVVTCAAFCGVPIATYAAMPAYLGVVAPLSLAGCIAYLWLTRWRRGDY